MMTAESDTSDLDYPLRSNQTLGRDLTTMQADGGRDTWTDDEGFHRWICFFESLAFV
jgi:hypothetical protein